MTAQTTIVVLSGLIAVPPAYADSTTVTFDVFGSPAIPIPIGGRQLVAVLEEVLVLPAVTGGRTAVVVG